jgi:Bacterial SH3 domain
MLDLAGPRAKHFAQRGNGKIQMPIGQASIGARQRLRLALLVAGLGAGLGCCSDPGIVTTQVKLQRAPATDSEVLAIIPRGSAIKVRDCTNGWCLVSWNGRDGYVLTKNVRIGDSARRTADTGTPDDDTDDNVPAPDSSAPAAPL